MKKHYSAAELPLTTSNASLAFALYLAGAAFAYEDAPLAHIYDAAILKNLGYSGPVETAVAEAFAARKKGHVEYAFSRNETFALAYSSFHAMQKAEEKDNRAARALVHEIMEKHGQGILTQSEALAASVCVVLKRWRGALKLWQDNRTFNAQRNKHEVANYDAKEQIEKLFLTGDFYKFAAGVMDAREVFLKLCWNYPPQIRFRHKGGAQILDARQGEHRRKSPGYSILSTGIPDNDIRKHLNLPTK